MSRKFFVVEIETDDVGEYSNMYGNQILPWFSLKGVIGVDPVDANSVQAATEYWSARILQRISHRFLNSMRNEPSYEVYPVISTALPGEKEPPDPVKEDQ